MATIAELTNQISSKKQEIQRLEGIVKKIEGAHLEVAQQLLYESIERDMHVKGLFQDEGYHYIENVKTKMTQVYQSLEKMRDDIKHRTEAIMQARDKINEKITTLKNAVSALEKTKSVQEEEEKQKEKQKQAASGNS